MSADLSFIWSEQLKIEYDKENDVEYKIEW